MSHQVCNSILRYANILPSVLKHYKLIFFIACVCRLDINSFLILSLDRRLASIKGAMFLASIVFPVPGKPQTTTINVLIVRFRQLWQEVSRLIVLLYLLVLMIFKMYLGDRTFAIAICFPI
jgi:hypothetical protein